MRADAPVLVAGVASFPRVEAEKDPELYARWESLTIAYLKGNTGIISVRLSCTTMKNSRTYIFVCSDTEVNAKALHYGHKAKKNFIAASRRSKTTITPKSRSTAEWPAWGQRSSA